MDQRNFPKTLTALLVLSAYILLLVHNLVPHQHAPAPESHAHQLPSDLPPHKHEQAHHHDHDQEHPQSQEQHHHHDHDQEHAPKGHEGHDQPDQEAGHLFSSHQHSFADNKIHHLDTHSVEKVSQKKVIPVLLCVLSFQHYLLRIPDPQPDPPPYFFPPGDFAGRARSLRGPPLA